MATREDAGLVMQIVMWAQQLGFDDAVHTLMREDFDPNTAATTDPAVGKVLAFGELVGTFVKHDVLDRDFVLDMWAMHVFWKRVGPAALRLRERIGEPRAYENFEALAQR